MLMCIPCSIFQLHTWHAQAGRLLYRSRFLIGWTAFFSAAGGCFLIYNLVRNAVPDPLLWPLFCMYPLICIWLIYTCLELNDCFCCCCKHDPNPPRPQFSWMSEHWANVYLHEHLATLRPPSDKSTSSDKDKSDRLQTAVCPACWKSFQVPKAHENVSSMECILFFFILFHFILFHLILFCLFILFF